ncbi:hypothetical protein LIA77_09498 [Sarocladium implicatum]|nr:hypothetical protein LIA77_09498 [Sarocladium implicatum]
MGISKLWASQGVDDAMRCVQRSTHPATTPWAGPPALLTHGESEMGSMTGHHENGAGCSGWATMKIAEVEWCRTVQSSAGIARQTSPLQALAGLDPASDQPLNQTWSPPSLSRGICVGEAKRQHRLLSIPNPVPSCHPVLC